MNITYAGAVEAREIAELNTQGNRERVVLSFPGMLMKRVANSIRKAAVSFYETVSDPILMPTSCTEFPAYC